MNDWFAVKDSGIAGKGAFAIRDIPKGTSIIQYKGKLLSKEISEKRGQKHRDDGELWIFTLNETYDIDASKQGNEARFINHSCNPNCEAVIYDEEEIWLEAIRDIKKGEELTFNYGFDEPDEVFPCLCGEENCRGWIVKEDYKFSPGEHEKLLKLHEEWKEEKSQRDKKKIIKWKF
ncbi:MAG: SET domain-containing protein [Candidatus Woesearchaeota archaeon]